MGSGGATPLPTSPTRGEESARLVVGLNAFATKRTRSEVQSGGLTYAMDLAHFRYDLGRRGAVDRDERDRRAAGLVAPERKCRNIDAGVSKATGEAADEARLVLVGDIDHRRGEFGVDLDALDRKNTRLTVMKDGSADRARLLRRRDREGDEAFVVALRGA